MGLPRRENPAEHADVPLRNGPAQTNIRNVPSRGGVGHQRRSAMAEDQEVDAARDAIGRRLATQIEVERELPERLKTLLRELRHQDASASRGGRSNGR